MLVENNLHLYQLKIIPVIIGWKNYVQHSSLTLTIKT